MSRIWFAAVFAAIAALGSAGPALADQRLSEQLSTGPGGGNGAAAAVYRGASADGTRVFFQTTESLVSTDTDGSMDVYERASGATTLISTGPNGGNGAFSATFLAASTDGSRVFIRTAEKLVASDTDSAQDIYERANGATTLISTGPNGGNGSFNAFFRGMSDDGSKVFFETDEPLVSTDFDLMNDVYQRQGGTTTHLSIGPAGGNGNIDFDYDAFFTGASADGSKVWIKTDEVLTYDDTDTFDDIYQVSGGGITRISSGPDGGNGPFGAFFDGASQDGSRIFIDTMESLVAADTDTSYDIYEISGGQATLLSTGPNGGNGAFFAAFRGATPTGSHVYFETYEPLTTNDTDTNQDVYDRSGSVTSLVSAGSGGGNGDVPASFQGSSADGARAFFGTAESLVLTDTDGVPDIYERYAGDTALISTGPAGLNAELPATYDGASADGTRVFFETAEPLVVTDLDSAQDVYGSSVVSAYPRPKGASPLRTSLVPAYRPCAAPNRMHGAPLSHPSCNPPTQASGFLTIGTPDANGKAASSSGWAKFTAVAGNTSTPANEADLKLQVSITDVRRKSDLADYAGQLQLSPSIRMTDRLNGSAPVDPATVSDFSFPATVPCTATSDTNVGSTCSVLTSADSVLPGAIVEVKRTVIEVGQVKVFDGGSDGLAATPDNSLFEVQGVFTP